MKVEVFTAMDPARLQNMVNEFLGHIEGKNAEVKDVKFSTAGDQEKGDLHFSAMIVFDL